MSLGARIEQLIGEMGISQSELARRARVPQTTLNSLIRRESRSSPHLLKIARELGTTVAYLAGDTDDRHEEFPTDSLSSFEAEMVRHARAMSERDRQLIGDLMVRLAQLAGVPWDDSPDRAPTLHDQQHAYRTG